MRKLLLIAAILLFIACFIAGMLACFNRMRYHNARDGSAALYARLHHRMIVSCVVAAVLAALGAACLIIRSKL